MDQDIHAVSLAIHEFFPNENSVEILPVAGGFVNRIWLLRSEQSEIILKQFNSKFSESRIEAACSCQRFIHDRLQCSPEVLLGTDGRPYFRCNETYYMASKAVRGESRTSDDMSESDWAALGEFLGCIHCGMREFDQSSISDNYLLYPDDPIAAIDELIVFYGDQKGDDFCERSLRRRRELLRKFDKPMIECFSRLSRQIVHGDFKLNNVIYATEDGQPQLIDFDQLSIFPWAYEVIRGFVSSVNIDDDLSAIEAKFSAFVRGYTGKSRVSLPDAQCAVAFYYWVLLSELRSYTDTDKQVRGIRDFAVSRMKTIEWIDSNFDRLTKVFSHACLG